MKTSHQTIPSASDSHRPQQKPFPAKWAALFLASALSGCGVAPPQAEYVETNGHAEMVVVNPAAGPQAPLRERLAPIIENANLYRVYPSGEEGNFGSAAGGWTFRLIESESSERAGLYFYDLIPHRSIMGSGNAESVGRIALTRTINPNFNIPLEPSEYTPSVGGDVSIMAAPGIAIFRFFNPNLGAFDIRSADLGESEATEVPMGALTSVVYKPDEKTIEVYYISDEKTVVVQFSLLSTNTTMRPVE